MFELREHFQKFGRLAAIFTTWLLLSGISRGPNKANFGLKDLQKHHFETGHRKMKDTTIGVFIWEHNLECTQHPTHNQTKTKPHLDVGKYHKYLQYKC